MSGLLIEIINQFDLNDKKTMLNSLPSAGESGTLKYIGGNTVLEGNLEKVALWVELGVIQVILRKTMITTHLLMVNNFSTR